MNESQEKKNFWKQVYASAIAAGKSDSYAFRAADQALRDYVERWS